MQRRTLNVRFGSLDDDIISPRGRADTIQLQKNRSSNLQAYGHQLALSRNKSILKLKGKNFSVGNIDTPATSLDRGREAKLSVDNLLKEFDQIHETQDSRETIN